VGFTAKAQAAVAASAGLHVDACAIVHTMMLACRTLSS
jgi:hypothetical protein